MAGTDKYVLNFLYASPVVYLSLFDAKFSAIQSILLYANASDPFFLNNVQA